MPSQELLANHLLSLQLIVNVSFVFFDKKTPLLSLLYENLQGENKENKRKGGEKGI